MYRGKVDLEKSAEKKIEERIIFNIRLNILIKGKKEYYGRFYN